MAESYGKTPTEILFAEDTGMTTMERYRVNQDIHTAVGLFKDNHSDQGGSGSSGPADSQQQRQLIEKNKQRADQSESMQKSGQETPSLTDQQTALKDARNMQSGGQEN